MYCYIKVLNNTLINILLKIKIKLRLELKKYNNIIKLT